MSAPISTTPAAAAWFEINTPNKQGAVDFYTNVFGFSVVEHDMGEHGSYAMFNHNDNSFGGVQVMSGPEWDGIPPNWMIYFDVPNLEGSMDTIKSLGGSVMAGPIDVPGGRIAVCMDNQNGAFSVYAGQEPARGTEAIDWLEHMSQDREKAKAFYTTVLNCEAMDQEMGEPVGTYTMFHRGEYFFAGAMKSPDPNMPAFWMVYFMTSDLNGTIDKVKANGGSLMHGPMDIGQFGHIAIASDTAGAVFGIHQPPTMG